MNNNDNYSAGVYADWSPDAAVHVEARAGVLAYEFQQTSQAILEPQLNPITGINPVTVHTNGAIQTSSFDSWYASLRVAHNITKSLGYSLSAGRETQSGIESDAVSDYYARLSASWRIFKDLSLTASADYENGNQGVGNIRGNLTESFSWVSAGLSADYFITKKVSLGLKYRITTRSSDQYQLGYTQNLVGLLVSYHPS